MSRTWDLEVTGLRDTQVRLGERGLNLEVAIDCPFGQLSCELDDDEAREMRNWLSWYLGEGPEPGGSS